MGDYDFIKLEVLKIFKNFEEGSDPLKFIAD